LTGATYFVRMRHLTKWRTLMGGRPPIGKVAMTASERQRRYWLKAKAHIAELEQVAAAAASAKTESSRGELVKARKEIAALKAELARERKRREAAEAKAAEPAKAKPPKALSRQ
jgi:hypothetical protein